jgi:hypothetical protein
MKTVVDSSTWFGLTTALYTGEEVHTLQGESKILCSLERLITTEDTSTVSVSTNFFLDWPQTMILLISASGVARIRCISHGAQLSLLLN